MSSMLSAANQAAHLLREYERLVAALDDSHRAWAPVPQGKTAGWLIGHLTVTGDFGRRLCGRPPLAPKEWRPVFSPGTTPGTDPAGYPPMTSLVETFRAVYADFVASAPAVPAEALAAVNPYEPARPAFPTAGAFAEYMLTGHLAYHLGQLSGWWAARAMSGA